jgi:hypothetical protein
MTPLRKRLFALVAAPALLFALSATPSAAAMGKGPDAAEPCGVSGRCGDAPTHYVNIRRPEDD